jgi:hypothetical protein
VLPFVDSLEDGSTAEEREGKVIVHQFLTFLDRHTRLMVVLVMGELLCVDLDRLFKSWDACVGEIDTSEAFHELIVGRQGVRQTELW